jgi:hypothetical protein
MMAPGETYAQAVAHWATYLCRSSNPGAGFCEWSYTVGNRPANGWDLVFTVIGAVSLAAGAVGGSALRGAAAASKEAGWLNKAAKAVSKTCNSFLGDTQVLMADGSTKRIDELKVGDEIFATDPDSGESGGREVLATLTNKGAKHLVEVQTGDGKIVATAQHPFWLPDEKRWADASELRPGSVLQTPAGTQVRVTAVKHRFAITRVHNLTVANLHTYYVMAGGTPVLVHNSPPLCGVHGGDIGSPPGPGIVDGAAPLKAHDMLDMVKNRPGGIGKVPGYEGNQPWGNKLNQLPGGKYREWDVNATADLPTCSVCGRPIRGGERLLTPKSGSGSVYYTPDHYGTFYYVGEYP